VAGGRPETRGQIDHRTELLVPEPVECELELYAQAGGTVWASEGGERMFERGARVKGMAAAAPGVGQRRYQLRASFDLVGGCERKRFLRRGERILVSPRGDQRARGLPEQACAPL